MNSLKSWKMESLTVNSSAGGYRRCACGEPVGVVECPEAVCQRVEKPVAVGVRHFDVRGYASAVAHLPSGASGVDVCQAVGDSAHRAVGIAVGVVDGLYQASAGNVVFGYGHFQQAVVWQRACSCTSPFAE